MVKTAPVFVTAALWAGLAAYSQQNAGAPGAAGHAEMHQTANPVRLYEGLGSWHRTISTGGANGNEAQKYFDQGLILLYGFNRYEALRSFTKAAELDPKAAMPWWGIAAANGPHINMDGDGDFNPTKSCEALDTAGKLAANIAEKAWVKAAASRCPAYDPQKYAAAMRELMRQYPDDPDVMTMFAESLMIGPRWHWYDATGKAAPGVNEAEAVLERVLRRYPNHPGANHFYIHAVESSRTPERAIPSAYRLMGNVPGAGHLIHMPGHIWLVLGEYDTAANVNERAAELDRQYQQTSGVTDSAYMGYYIHNVHFVAVARSMQGRKADAIRAADQIGRDVLPMMETMTEMVDSFAGFPMLMRVRFGAWDEILAAAQPAEKLPVDTAIWRYARASAFAGLGQRDEALKEQTLFELARQKVSPKAPWLNNPAKDILAIASEVLAGRLTKGAPAIAHWARAAALQDALVYDEPPGWYYPVRESWGAELLRSGRAAEAETVFREGLRRSPKNGRILFGLLESLKAQKKDAAAEWVQREFDAAWKQADVKLRIEDL